MARSREALGATAGALAEGSAPTNDPIPGVTGIVLAGGRSIRFGGDKLGALVDGRSLLERSIDAIAAVCGEVVVVVAPDGGRVPPGPSFRAVRFVADPEPFGGPLVGTAAGLGAATGEIALVAGGDMPWLEPAVLRLLVAALDVPGAHRAAAVLEGAAGGRDGAPGVERFPFALRTAEARLAAGRLVGAGERRMRMLLRDLDPVRIPEERWRLLDPEARTTRDVDRPEDLPGGE